MPTIENSKTDTLIKRLQTYDKKYYEAISKPLNINFGYAMRAYHAMKVQNPPEWKIKDKAILISDELIKREIKFSTIYLRLRN